MISRELKINVLFLAFAVVIVIAVGALTFSYIEGWSYLNAVYFVVMTATTVGYGDITPVTEMGKIMTMIFALSIIPLVLYLFSLMARVETAQVYKKLSRVERRQEEHTEDIEKAHRKIEEQRHRLKLQEEELEKQERKLKLHSKELGVQEKEIDVQEKELEVVEDVMEDALVGAGKK